jgi:hypothetical protein
MRWSRAILVSAGPAWTFDVNDELEETVSATIMK